MKIELYIDGEKKLFTAPVAPMLAKRKYLEITAKAEEKARKTKEEGKNYYPSSQDQIDEDDEMLSILSDTVFDGQFTVEQLYKGASNDYIYGKLYEAVFGKKKENEGDEGNEQGE